LPHKQPDLWRMKIRQLDRKLLYHRDALRARPPYSGTTIMAPKLSNQSIAYDGWTQIIRVRVRLEDGTEVQREVEDHGRAAAVLPYDPVRRTALLVRQLRVPVLVADGVPELLEAPAGILDEDDPAEGARREAREEAGIALTELEHVVRAWSLPGISTEQMDLFIAAYSQADRVGPGGGVASENITVVEMALDTLWSMVERKELVDMKTLTLVLMLRARRPHLFSVSA
jgi:nudix-type nucleoside diphosphatase (YffH/AdpP family)